jgi:hypothetical protein
MSLGAIIVLVLILAVAGVIPAWPYSRSWGYAPSGALSVMLVFLGAMVVLGKI